MQFTAVKKRDKTIIGYNLIRDDCLHLGIIIPYLIQQTLYPNPYFFKP